MAIFTNIPDDDISVGGTIKVTWPGNMADNITAIAQQDPTAPVQFLKYGIELLHKGFVSGTTTITSTSPTGSVWEADTIDLSVTSTLKPNGNVLFMRARQQIDIHGILNVNGNNSSNPITTAHNPFMNIGGSGAGGGGSDTGAGSDGQDSFGRLAGAGGAISTVGANGLGRAAVASDGAGKEILTCLSHFARAGGGAGGIGAAGTTTGLTSAGGLGAGIIVLIAPIINLKSTSQLLAVGQDGVSGFDGGGGGGGGGCIILVRDSGETLGTIDVSGGSGGTGADGSGGDGGDGLLLDLQFPLST